MANSTLIKKGSTWISQAEYDAKLAAGTLEVGVEYNITKDSDHLTKTDAEKAFVAKIKGETGTVVYANISGTDSSLDVRATATANTIALRGTNGVLKVSTPVDDSDAATKRYVDDAVATGIGSLTFDETPTEGSKNPVYSKGIKEYVDTAKSDAITTAESFATEELKKKQDTLTFDTAPKAESTNPVTSAGIKTYVDTAISGVNEAVAGKQDKLTFDKAPTADSKNPVTSGGVKTYVDDVTTKAKTDAIAGAKEYTDQEVAKKQDALTFDAKPTADSTNPVESKGIKSYVDDAISGVTSTAEGKYLPMQEKSSAADEASVYAVAPEGSGTSAADRQTMIVASTSEDAKTLALRDNDGNISVTAPTHNLAATNKKYVDDELAKKLDITGGTITGGLEITGDLTVKGTTTTEKAETLAVKDSVIVTNADGAALGATLSGIAIRKDATNTYGVMYDPASDSVKLGLGTLDEENSFTFNESGTDGKAIATRADSADMVDGNFTKWDATTKSIIDSGKSADSFVAKKTTTAGTFAYGYDADGEKSLTATAGADASTLALRGANGVLSVGTPTANAHATTKKYVDDGLAKKQDTLAFDSTPTAGSANPVTSAGIKSYVDAMMTITITEGA